MRQIEILIGRLHRGIVPFVYTKKDGTLRHALGTLRGVENTIKGTRDRHDCSWTLRYYDVDCHAWRSFVIDNLVSVGEVRRSTIEEHHDICLALVIRLKERMERERSVAFAYRKADGTIRYAHGTLCGDSLCGDNLFVYYDTDKREKRAFRIDSFIGFGEDGEIDINIFDDDEDVEEKDTKEEFKSYSHIAGSVIGSILAKNGIDAGDTERTIVVDLLPYLNKTQLKDLIIDATKRLAAL